jgi:hypothetical protein
MKGDIGYPDDERHVDIQALGRTADGAGFVTFRDPDLRDLAARRRSIFPSEESQAVYERARFAQRAQERLGTPDENGNDPPRPLDHSGSPDIGRGFATEGAHLYVGDDDHAEPYIDRGGRDTREHGDSAKLDGGKLRYDLIPVGPLRELARVYTIGAAKYAPRGWESGMDWSRIIAAMQRHVEAWRDGETLDPVDGQHHLSSVAWCAFALMEFERTHPDLDDRPL